MTANVSNVRTRLSVLMFLEFLLWASWYVPIGGYMNGVLHFTGAQIGWIYATTAIGAIVAPMFVGFIADRLFATERVLGVLHLLGGACVLLASMQESFPALMTLLVINAFCFMPTLGLANSITFRNIDDPNRFSRIAVWGTIGWIVSGNTVDFLLGGSSSGAFFYLSAGGSFVLAIFCFLALPHTPPKGKESGGDVLGLGALKLLREPSFLVFAVCAFLISIPLTFYFTWCHAFLTETERPSPTALMTLGQVSEIFVMLIMPWFIGRIGLKKVIVIGMTAWAVRYVLFASGSFPLIFLGILVHGFCYCFVFVASFIYVSKKAPPEMSASAQSLVSLIMWGLGMFVGAKLSGFTAEKYPAPQSITAMKGTEKLVEQALPVWTDGETFHIAVALGATTMEAVKAGAVDSLDIAVVEKLPGGEVKAGELSYDRAGVLTAVRTADLDKDGKLTRMEWQTARSHQWPPIWLWPSALAAVVAFLFLVGGKDVVQAKPVDAGQAK